MCIKTEPYYSHITTVTLRLLFSKDNNNYHYKNINCDGKDKDVEFSYLSENTRYTIQSVWEMENTTYYCEVMEFYTCKFCMLMTVFCTIKATYTCIQISKYASLKLAQSEKRHEIIMTCKHTNVCQCGCVPIQLLC